MFANDEFGKNIRDFKKCSWMMNLEKIYATLKKCSRTMNLEKIFATLIKSSLTFFKVTNFCGSRTFFSIPTNNICGSRTYFQIYCLWTFLKSPIFSHNREHFFELMNIFTIHAPGVSSMSKIFRFFVHIFLFFALFTMPAGHLEGVSEILDLDDTLTVLRGPKWRFS